MPTKADLLFAAEALASNARLQLDPPKVINGKPTDAVMPNPGRAAEHVAAAKVALEAAALASNTSTSDIDQALEGMQDLLAEAGVMDKATQMEPDEFLQQAFEAMLAWRRQVLAAQGFEVGYDMLRELLEDMESDFNAAGTATAARLAARIRGRLDEATEILGRARALGSDDARLEVE